MATKGDSSERYVKVSENRKSRYEKSLYLQMLSIFPQKVLENTMDSKKTTLETNQKNC